MAIKHKPLSLSIIIPLWNGVSKTRSFLNRLHQALSPDYKYEVIFVGKPNPNFIDKKYPIKIVETMKEGLQLAQAPVIVTIDADFQYPPESIPLLMKEIVKGADIVVAERVIYNARFLRKVDSFVYKLIFGRYLHELPYDVRSGLKAFKKEVIQRIPLHTDRWRFDLELLKQSQDAGYKITTIDTSYFPNDISSIFSILYKSVALVFFALQLKFTRSQAIPFDKKNELDKGKGFHYKGNEFIHHSNLHHSNSALYIFSSKQIALLYVLLAVIGADLFLNWHGTIVVIIALLTFFYFIDLIFNCFLILRNFNKSHEIEITNEEIRIRDKLAWPKYTIFCPLYQEWSVVPQFVSAMKQLEYPKSKLQVMLLLEEDDTQTINKVKDMKLPEYFKVVVVPDSKPKTKPKACNYGLRLASGEYIVIFDAEDVPEVSQLKKAVIAFEKAEKDVVCVQAKLNFYNPQHNLLTRIFTAEYSLWFDLILTGLQSITAPIPLGGTSNHFKKQMLTSLGGWDSFNVTEDCDLGIRLAKRGYRTEIINSLTLEEANSSLSNWFNQRTRWIKGYFQTYLVHMRQPADFIKNNKAAQLINFQIIVGGKVLSMLINPIMWIITALYFAKRTSYGFIIETFFPGPILYIGTVSLVVGNFLYLYYYMIGCAKRGNWWLIKYIYLVPFYWLAMSVAAWVAVYRLFTNPHYWFKTKHGLHLDNHRATSQSKRTIKQFLLRD